MGAPQLCVCVGLSLENLTLQHLDLFRKGFLFTRKAEYVDLPVKSRSDKGTFLRVVWFHYVCSGFVLFYRGTANKEQNIFSHQAPFEANWVFTCNGFATGHGGCGMVEVEFPLVEVECN